jgi:HK97 family phage prohead protease
MPKDKKEIRYIPAEMRVDAEGRIEGYAAVFGKWSEVLGFFKERIRNGAFSKTLEEADVRALFNHDPNYVLGRNKSGTLELSEDDHGLQFRVDPPDAGWANDLQASVKRGDIDQASFGFQAVRDEWDHNKDPMERELIEVKLMDVSVVTYPAYPQTSVSARMLGEMFISRVQHADNQEEIRFMLEQLDEIIANSTPGQEPHLEEGQSGAEQQPTGNALLKRRLELVKLQLIDK